MGDNMDNGIGKIRARLRNWGCWLNHEAHIGPKGAQCISLESRYLPESGEVWSDDDQPMQTPDVPDAETLQAHISQLEHIQQYALAVTYGGSPAVMRWRRIGEHALQHSLEQAEFMLYEALRKSA